MKNLCDNLYEVHVNTPLNECIKRDDSGIYDKAKEGKIKNLPGVDIEYEEPKNCTLTFNIKDTNEKEAAKQIYNEISKSI